MLTPMKSDPAWLEFASRDVGYEHSHVEELIDDARVAFSASWVRETQRVDFKLRLWMPRKETLTAEARGTGIDAERLFELVSPERRYLTHGELLQLSNLAEEDAYTIQEAFNSKLTELATDILATHCHTSHVLFRGMVGQGRAKKYWVQLVLQQGTKPFWAANYFLPPNQVYKYLQIPKQDAA